MHITSCLSSIQFISCSSYTFSLFCFYQILFDGLLVVLKRIWWNLMLKIFLKTGNHFFWKFACIHLVNWKWQWTFFFVCSQVQFASLSLAWLENMHVFELVKLKCTQTRSDLQSCIWTSWIDWFPDGWSSFSLWKPNYTFTPVKELWDFEILQALLHLWYGSCTHCNTLLKGVLEDMVSVSNLM